MGRAFLTLGDSYTVGEGVAPDARWPVQLAVRLRATGVAIDGPQVVAATGWTTAELAAAMDAAVFTPPYALVTLLIGVNNQYRGLPVDDYRAEFRALLRRAIGLADGRTARVLVVSIPDWSVTPFAARNGCDPAATARAIAALNAIARAETAAARAHWVDVTTISRAAGARDAVTVDGLHPSAAQYARWVDAILPAARAALAAF
ncbi:MAG: SGNH/GDSL hydrolase family protein [Rhodanobacteraceae bacterium]|nr:MAG: SGNH/GDSL hydrolase family protein [Rhodanobacteraceae bacterium]